MQHQYLTFKQYSLSQSQNFLKNVETFKNSYSRINGKTHVTKNTDGTKSHLAVWQSIRVLWFITAVGNFLFDA